MYKIKAIEGTELSEYVVLLLENNEIEFVRQFLDAGIGKIAKMVNLSHDQVENIQKEFLARYAPSRVMLSNLYRTVADNKSIVAYGSGIESLDAMLKEEVLAAGSVWEICGTSNIGKSQLCHTLALNFVTQYEGEALYIDTRCCFSGIHMREMLRSRNVDKEECVRVMTQLRVVRSWSAESIIAILEQLLLQLEAGNAAAKTIKLIIIDSLPALWFLLENSVEANYLKSKLANLVWKLADRHFKTFILVNLSVEKSVENNDLKCDGEENNQQYEDYESDCSEETVSSSESPQNDAEKRSALGIFWLSVPEIRLSLEMPKYEDDESPDKRIIKVLKSCYSATGESCEVTITDKGVL